MYVADVNRRKVFEIDQVMWDVLGLYSSLTEQEIIQELTGEHERQEILGALEDLAEMAETGAIFSGTVRGGSSANVDDCRPRILVAQAPPHIEDMALVAGGSQIAHCYLLNALTEHAWIDVMHTEDKQFGDRMRGIAFRPDDRACLLRLMETDYDGILVRSHLYTQSISLLRYLDAPTIVPIYAARGGNGAHINAALV